MSQRRDRHLMYGSTQHAVRWDNRMLVCTTMINEVVSVSAAQAERSGGYWMGEAERLAGRRWKSAICGSSSSNNAWTRSPASCNATACGAASWPVTGSSTRRAWVNTARKASATHSSPCIVGCWRNTACRCSPSNWALSCRCRTSV